MFGFGATEAMVLGVIVLLLFGRRLPGLFRSLGESLPAFKKGLAQDQISNTQQPAPRQALEVHQSAESS